MGASQAGDESQLHHHSEEVYTSVHCATWDKEFRHKVKLKQLSKPLLFHTVMRPEDQPLEKPDDDLIEENNLMEVTADNSGDRRTCGERLIKVNDNWLTKPLLSHNHLREGAGLKGGHQRETLTTDSGEVWDSYYDQLVTKANVKDKILPELLHNTLRSECERSEGSKQSMLD